MFRKINLGGALRAIARLRGRATVKVAKGARLAGSARIYNMGNNDADISIGAGSIVRGELVRLAHGGQITIGKSCYIGEGTRIWSGCSISIGDHVLIAHNVSVFDNLTHPIDWRERRKHFADISKIGHPSAVDLEDRAVVINDDVWIGVNALILRGVTIGARAIVAAGAVVTKDVLPDTIVAGNPAENIRKLERKQDDDIKC
jgi:acetyltransferase-like isoleucine patch superfamily enzyme